MFRAIILPIFRNTRLCVTACDTMHPRCCRPNASIRVQPTTTSRRTDGLKRESKCLASGRPVLGTKRASKRPRNLENANAISRNQPNAKSHGSGH